jgi:hypothetical protein
VAVYKKLWRELRSRWGAGDVVRVEDAVRLGATRESSLTSCRAEFPYRGLAEARGVLDQSSAMSGAAQQQSYEEELGIA